MVEVMPKGSVVDIPFFDCFTFAPLLSDRARVFRLTDDGRARRTAPPVERSSVIFLTERRNPYADSRVTWDCY